MKWSKARDRIVEGLDGTIKCWLLMNHKEKVLGIYVKIDEVSKFVPADEFEETLEGAKLRAEIEVERYSLSDRIAKLNKK